MVQYCTLTFYKGGKYKWRILPEGIQVNSTWLEVYVLYDLTLENDFSVKGRKKFPENASSLTRNLIGKFECQPCSLAKP